MGSQHQLMGYALRQLIDHYRIRENREAAMRCELKAGLSITERRIFNHLRNADHYPKAQAA